MQHSNIPIRIVFYKESELWIAHCLEFDLLGSGEDKNDAINCLMEAITLQISATIEFDNPANLYRPASGEIFRRWAMGREFDCNTLSGQLSISVEDVDIPSCSAREYNEGGNELAMAWD